MGGRDVKKPIPPCPRDCENRQVGCRKNCDAWLFYEVELGIYRSIVAKEWKGRLEASDIIRRGIRIHTHGKVK